MPQDFGQKEGGLCWGLFFERWWRGGSGRVDSGGGGGHWREFVVVLVGCFRFGGGARCLPAERREHQFQRGKTLKRP